MVTVDPSAISEVASRLGLSTTALETLLRKEFKSITANEFEKKQHPDTVADFTSFAISSLQQLLQHENNIQVLKKLIDREGVRQLYFFQNEISAIDKILFAIENGNVSYLGLDNLGLKALPPLLEKAISLEELDISHNELKTINRVAHLPKLVILSANNNQLTDISPLTNINLQVLHLDNNPTISDFSPIRQLHNLQRVSLMGNRINDNKIIPILNNPSIKEINLSNNPLDVPQDILTDIDKIRAHFKKPGNTTPEKQYTASPPYRQEKLVTDGGFVYNLDGNPADDFLYDENDTSIEATYSFFLPGDDFLYDENDTPPQPASNNAPGSAPPPNTTTPQETYASYATRDVRLRGNPDKNLLDIEKLAPLFYNLIANSDNNGEHFFGLFGRWGRGKTFFWKYILENNLDKKKYIPIEFHAWKYQDTPGIWAYLYSELNNRYFNQHDEQPGKRNNILVRIWRLLKLNWIRGKILKPALLFTGSILFSILLFIFLTGNIEFFKQVQITIITGIGIFSFTLWSFLSYLNKAYKADAKKIISQATTNVNFKTQLGLQHEIQQELIYLLKAWIPEKKKYSRRLFLFIDDIDRCSEDKIIQIVDYIRVLLHDRDIQDRVTVLAAIDERVLLHAIQNKYKNFIEDKDNDATYKELCREYMDKLFLAGLKLGPLTEYEKRQIVEGFTARDTSTVEEGKNAEGMNAVKVAEVVSATGSKEQGIKGIDTSLNKTDVTIEIPEGGVPGSLQQATNKIPEVVTASTATQQAAIPSTAKKEFLYEKWEQEFIKNILARNTESTPRSIRVYSYRYLLGKQLVEKALTEGKESWKQWYNTKEAKQCFAIKLLHYSFKSDTERLMIDYKLFITGYHENNVVKENIYGEEISLNQELGSIMFQVLTMIIAY